MNEVDERLISIIQCYNNCMIQSTQKVIKIGSSAGVTVPAKQMEYYGIKIGDYVKVTFQKVNKKHNEGSSKK